MTQKGLLITIHDLKLGTDLVFVPRLAASYQRYGDAFFQKLLTETEIIYCHAAGSEVFLRRAAGKIALKEAVSKALGVGLNGLGWAQGANWKEIETLAARHQPPSLKLHGRTLAIAQQNGISDWRLSLSHDGEYAMATVVGLVQ